MKMILALGGGVNSTAIIALKALRKLPIDFDTAIFADTGTEQPQTYKYMENILKPYCQIEGINLIIVRSPLKSLYSHYYKNKIIPTRMYRHCTDKFKIQPMKKYCNKNYPDGYIFIMGIDAGEAHRAKTDGYYPLIDLKIDREGCKKIIKKAGLPIPVKSGCICCPFTPPKDYQYMSNHDPETFKKVVALEKNCRRYPEITISTKPLEILAHKEPENQKLCNWINKCAYCE